jgi:hypothetical protein
MTKYSHDATQSPVRSIVNRAARTPRLRDIRPLALTLMEEIGQTAPSLETSTAARELLIIQSKLHKLAELRCDGVERLQPLPDGGYYRGGSWFDCDEAEAEALGEELRYLASRIAEPFKATVRIGGDPRGACLYLDLASGRRNSWGAGWAVMFEGE